MEVLTFNEITSNHMRVYSLALVSIMKKICKYLHRFSSFFTEMFTVIAEK